MTPLAAYLAKQLVLRPKHREHIWSEQKNLKMLREALDDIHCFEVSGIIQMVLDLSETMQHQGELKAERMFETFAFLPAPKTWLEWRHGSGNKIGILLEDDKKNGITPYSPGYPKSAAKNPTWSIATFFCETLAADLGGISTDSGDYLDFGGERYFPNWLTARDGINPSVGLLVFAHLMLLVVNSPRIIGRRQHMPNAGLERRMTTGLGAGSFPLHAWTEILLKVNKPIEIDDGEPHEAHLTGKRALHFCRKHIRIRNGRLEYVNAHWRGDPAIGIKQSRYNVVA